eukprot:366324-Chlamydomonas_euryale.AAC.2
MSTEAVKMHIEAVQMSKEALETDAVQMRYRCRCSPNARRGGPNECKGTAQIVHSGGLITERPQRQSKCAQRQAAQMRGNRGRAAVSTCLPLACPLARTMQRAEGERKGRGREAEGERKGSGGRGGLHARTCQKLSRWAAPCNAQKKRGEGKRKGRGRGAEERGGAACTHLSETEPLGRTA